MLDVGKRLTVRVMVLFRMLRTLPCFLSVRFLRHCTVLGDPVSGFLGIHGGAQCCFSHSAVLHFEISPFA